MNSIAHRGRCEVPHERWAAAFYDDRRLAGAVPSGAAAKNPRGGAYKTPRQVIGEAARHVRAKDDAARRAMTRPSPAWVWVLCFSFCQGLAF